MSGLHVVVVSAVQPEDDIADAGFQGGGTVFRANLFIAAFALPVIAVMQSVDTRSLDLQRRGRRRRVELWVSWECGMVNVFSSARLRSTAGLTRSSC